MAPTHFAARGPKRYSRPHLPPGTAPMRSSILRLMIQTPRHWGLPLLAAIGLSLSACGQKGPLTLPNHDQASVAQFSGQSTSQENATTKSQATGGQP